MSLFRIFKCSVLIILMVIIVKGSCIYCDETSTEVVQKMPLTGSVVKEKSKEINSDSDEKVEEVKKIDINNADIEELKILHGVGPVIAKRIIEYRKIHGRFNTIEEIMKVKGIGKKKFKEMKNMITVKEPISKKDDSRKDDERSNVESE